MSIEISPQTSERAPSLQPSAVCTYRRGIPHIHAEGSVYFVTYRLADSVPSEVKDSYFQRKEALYRKYSSLENYSNAERRKLNGIVCRDFEAILDRSYGSCVLRQDEAAEIAINSVLFFDGERYRVRAVCVMPNHVHALVEILAGYNLSKIVGAWKRNSAVMINRILGTSGRLWQRDYFDRLMRGEKHYVNAANYILNNPAKAGLMDWKWVWMRTDEGRDELGMAAGQGSAECAPSTG